MRISTWLAVLCLAVHGITWAQDVREVTLERPSKVKETLGSSAGLQPRQTTAERQKYLSALARIREHMRPVPLQASAKPFSTDPAGLAAGVVKKTEPVSFPKSIKILSQVSVTQSAKLQLNFASPIGEPTVAYRGKEVLVTGNWYAALSIDGGTSFRKLDPYAMLQNDPLGGGFCCDQVAVYDLQEDTIFWLLQGTRNERGNTIRILAAKGDAAIRAEDWSFVDVTSTAALGSEQLWLDFPSVALTKEFIYFSANVFSTVGQQEWKGTMVARLSKAALARGDAPTAQVWTSALAGSPRLVSDGGTTAYWAAHGSTGRLSIWHWDDGLAAPKGPSTVEVERWSEQDPNKPSSQSPSGRPWLTRLDGRITSAWLSGQQLGFAWSAREDNRFKLPHVRVAVVDTSKVKSAAPLVTVEPVSQPHIWSDKFAIAYPATSAGSGGKVGAIVTIGGRTLNPSVATGVFDPNAVGAKWGFAVARQGNNTPSCVREGNVVDRRCGVWGDYYSVQSHPTRAATWLTVGYTIRSRDVDPLQVEPEFISFESK